MTNGWLAMSADERRAVRWAKAKAWIVRSERMSRHPRSAAAWKLFTAGNLRRVARDWDEQRRRETNPHGADRDWYIRNARNDLAEAKRRRLVHDAAYSHPIPA